MSGWSVVTLHASNSEENEKLNEDVNRLYGDPEDVNDVPHAGGYAERTIQEARGANHKALARKYADKFGRAEQIIVVSANDTSDSGYGTLFDVTENGVEKVERWEGYEGAVGRDVTGYFREEYGVKGYATWEA